MVNWNIGTTPNAFFSGTDPKPLGIFPIMILYVGKTKKISKKLLENALKGGLPSSVAKKGGKSKKGAKNGDSGISANGTIMSDFRLEYAKSGGSKCGVCEEKIGKQ